MYPQHPELLVLVAEARRQELLASAERVRPVPAGLGPGYPAGVGKVAWRFLARLTRRRAAIAPAPTTDRRPTPAELAP